MRIRKKSCGICLLATALALGVFYWMGQSASQPQPTPLAGSGVDSKGQALPASLDDYRAARGKVPVLYSPEYNIGFWGMENLHPFDSKKYMKVYDALLTQKLLTAEQVYAPPMATDAQLALVHTPEYLKSLNDAATVAAITEVPPVAWLPAATARARVLVPMLYATGGTILGAVLAVEGPSSAAATTAASAPATAAAPAAAASSAGAAASTSSSAGSAAVSDAKDEKKQVAAPTATSSAAHAPGPGFGWAINLSGGYHHACGHAGGGFCVYADISIAILTVAKRNPALKRFMIVDLDAHQGNGHENDKRVGAFDGLQVYTMDMYNAAIYPRDTKAKKYIDCRVELKPHTADDEYLRLERHHLSNSLKAFHPQLLVYNAGTDCLEGDPLGQLSVSAAGIVKRDEIVFELARAHNVPVLMLLSGGYQKSNAAVIAQSIDNLNTKFNLFKTALAQSTGTATATAAAAAPANAAAPTSPASAVVHAPGAAAPAPPSVAATPKL